MFSLIACGPSIREVSVENPTEESVTFSVGEEMTPITVPANSKKKVKILFGKQMLNVEGGIEEEINLRAGKKYTLNPTKSEYIYEEVIYVDDSNPIYQAKPELVNNLAKKIPMDTITVMGFPLPGNYKKVNDLVLRDYDYGPTDRVPETIQITGTSASKVRVRSEADFIADLMREIQQYEGELEAEEN